MTVLEDRQAVIDGFTVHFKRAPSLPAAQLLHAVAIIESGFGRAWKSAVGRAANNYGAEQYATPEKLGLVEPYPPVSPDGRGFLYTDTRPNADGTSAPYHVYFKIYATPAAGAAGFARVVYEIRGRKTALAAAELGDVLGFSAALFDTVYYQGFGKNREIRIKHHYEAVMNAVTDLSRKLLEPMPGGELPPPATIKRGDEGEAVKTWQRILSLVADGMFGPATLVATLEFQRERGLKPDGIVGPATWAAAEDPPPVVVPTWPSSTAPPEDIAVHLRGVARHDVQRVVAAIHEAVKA